MIKKILKLKRIDFSKAENLKLNPQFFFPMGENTKKNGNPVPLRARSLSIASDNFSDSLLVLRASTGLARARFVIQ